MMNRVVVQKGQIDYRRVSEDSVKRQIIGQLLDVQLSDRFEALAEALLVVLGHLGHALRPRFPIVVVPRKRSGCDAAQKLKLGADDVPRQLTRGARVGIRAIITMVIRYRSEDTQRDDVRLFDPVEKKVAEKRRLL